MFSTCATGEMRLRSKGTVKNRGRFCATEEMICACVYVKEREKERVETQDLY